MFGMVVFVFATLVAIVGVTFVILSVVLVIFYVRHMYVNGLPMLESEQRS